MKFEELSIKDLKDLLTISLSPSFPLTSNNYKQSMSSTGTHRISAVNGRERLPD
jgi:hypothetical protein